MKVHITLKQAVRDDPQAKKEAFEEICNVASPANVNTRRFERHGILSADVEPKAVPAIDDLEAVQSVSVDSEQHAI